VRHSRLVLTTLLLVLWLPAGAPAAALANEPVLAPNTVCEPTLMPVSGAAAVRLESAILSASLKCEGENCRLRSEHVYQVQNTVPDEGVTAQVGLMPSAGGCSPDPEPTLRASETDLPRFPGTAEYPSAWQVTLPPAGTVRLTLTYERDLGTVHLVDWGWGSSALGAWGEVDSVRAELALPGPTTEEALLAVRPDGGGFDGLRLVWSHEGLANWPDHAASVLAPPVAARLAELRAAGGGIEYGRLLLALYTEAHARGLATPGWEGEIAAALLAAIAAQPDDPAVRMDLAELYRQQAGDDPDARRNHLLLAIRQLDEASRLSGGSADVLAALARCYYEAALAASEEGDPGAAMGYLEEAEALGGAGLLPEPGRSEALLLGWALGMAQQGQAQQAFARVADRLSPETLDTLLHYAPPVTWVDTRVLLRPGEREVVLTLSLYPPTAEDVRARLATLAQALHGVEGSAVAMDGTGAVVRLTLTEQYASQEECDALHARLLEVLSGSDDVLAAVLGAPFEGRVVECGVARRPFRDLFTYREHVDLTSVAAAWQGGSEYAGWRLAELSAATPSDEQARLETALALAALREQVAIWKQVPIGAQQTLQVAFAGADAPEPICWRVLWGETQEVTWTRSVWRWGRIGAAVGVVLVLVSGPAWMLHRRARYGVRGSRSKALR